MEVEFEFIQIVRTKLSNLDPEFVEEMEKMRRAMLLAKKVYPGQSLSMFLTSKRKKYPRIFETFKEEFGG